LHCPGLIQRHQALLGLVALCFPGCPNSLGEQNGTAPRWRRFQVPSLPPLNWRLPVTESVALPRES
jgi:hypothetical protein